MPLCLCGEPSPDGRLGADAGVADRSSRQSSSSSTQAHALCALLFLYRHVLADPRPWLDEIVRARRRERLPAVLTRGEVRRLFGALEGTPRLVAGVLYGGGLRLLEALRLRVKNLDFAANLIIVRQGKGDKDRRTILPEALKSELRAHVEWARRVHQKDWRAGSAPSPFRTPCSGSSRMPSASSYGNGCSRPRDCGATPRPVREAGTISTSP